MKKALLLYILCHFIFFGGINSYAQGIKNSFSSIYQLDTALLVKAKNVIPIQFGETNSRYTNKNLANALEKTEVISIKLYYSKFPKDIIFQENTQKAVNELRIKNLLARFPSLKTKNITIELVAQENCEDLAQAKALFHGFVIDYEMTNATILPATEPKKEETVTILKEKEKSIPKQKQVILDFGNINNEFSKDVKRKHIGRDSITYFAFERNIAQWDSVVIVADWTSSMYPYTLQLLIWQTQNVQYANKILGYVFFNDGDKTPDNQKKIGQIGGIYVSNSPHLPDALQKMDECKKNGNGGGDFDENNIEALLVAVQQFPNAKSIIMISDNYGKIKDLALLPKVKKPVHVILARMPDLRFLTEDYLQVALQTGGSLHLKNTDYQTIEKLQSLFSEVQLLKEEPTKKKKKKGK